MKISWNEGALLQRKQQLFVSTSHLIASSRRHVFETLNRVLSVHFNSLATGHFTIFVI